MMVRWLFLIPLTTGLLSGYISHYLMDEISYLTGAFSLISFIICLFIAPWQLQLVILVLVLLTVRLLWVKVNEQSESVNASSFLEEDFKETTSETAHQRTYRGIPYSSEETEEVHRRESQKKGTYRGIPWQSEQKKLNFVKETKFVRKYRGIPLDDPDETQPNDQN